MSPLEVFATVVRSLFDEVRLRGMFVAQVTTPPIAGVELNVRQEPYQADPTTVCVTFSSGHFEWMHRFDARHVAVIGGTR